MNWDEEWGSIVASIFLGIIGLLFLVGFFYLVGDNFARVRGDFPDDADCRVDSPLVDERPPECHEVCREGKALFMWGSQTYCYWDDNATAGAR